MRLVCKIHIEAVIWLAMNLLQILLTHDHSLNALISSSCDLCLCSDTPGFDQSVAFVFLFSTAFCTVSPCNLFQDLSYLIHCPKTIWSTSHNVRCTKCGSLPFVAGQQFVLKGPKIMAQMLPGPNDLRPFLWSSQGDSLILAPLPYKNVCDPHCKTLLKTTANNHKSTFPTLHVNRDHHAVKVLKTPSTHINYLPRLSLLLDSQQQQGNSDEDNAG